MQAFVCLVIYVILRTIDFPLAILSRSLVFGLAVYFIVLKQGSDPSVELAAELRRIVRKEVGAFAVIEKVYFVGKLPMNRSGNVMRRLGRAVVGGLPLGDTSTLDDATSVDELQMAIKGGGY